MVGQRKGWRELSGYRFVNVFVEGGVAYYFDNGSSIETIRSEKPFNAGFNVGLRLGF